jgi:hypothetical protein
MALGEGDKTIPDTPSAIHEQIGLAATTWWVTALLEARRERKRELYERLAK